MKPMLASALALGCVSAAMVTTAGNSQAAPSTQDRAAASISAARTNAQQHAGVGAGQGLVVRDTVLDAGGASHVRFERTFHGLEVVGGDFVVHQAQGGAFRSVTGRTMKPFSLPTTASVKAREATRKAAATVDFGKTRATPELVVLADHRAPTLAWRVDVTGRNADGSPAGEYVFVGARNGRVLDHWASVLEDTGTGTGIVDGTVSLQTTLSGGKYTMVDGTRGGNATYNGPLSNSSTPVFSDADNVWGNGSTSDPASAGVDAHYGIATTWDFYKNTYGRNGIANDGKGARSFVHDGAYVNASWSDSCFCMRYGDGDSTTYPLVALDVAGHEMSHGVTSRTANLTYRGESGGLNEANSDIFGTMVEWYANNAQDVPDYVIGEEIYRSYNPATNYIRRMDKPSLDGGSQDCYTTRTKSVDVHYSSGVANHYFYLLSEGSGAKTINGIAYNSPTCNGVAVTGIGRDAAAKIWYRALTVYMTSSTNYAGARVANVNAATDLYGAGSTQVAAVKAAWTAVAVK
ncbi:M4 family metallopeptidase [Nocardioides sp. MAHUQ-72]|uniref:M4 family metallopeptidase n=1 Tax=unclassified Nocardioides TaxID=2615069 RepID=UPI003613B1A2